MTKNKLNLIKICVVLIKNKEFILCLLTTEIKGSYLGNFFDKN